VKIGFYLQINIPTCTFMKSRPDLFHAEGETKERTDRHDEANVRFLQFC